MAEIQVLNSKIAQTASDQLYITYLDIDAETLYAAPVGSDLAIGTPIDFGACTEAELAARDYFVFVQTFNDPSVASNEDYALIFGKTRKT